MQVGTRLIQSRIRVYWRTTLMIALFCAAAIVAAAAQVAHAAGDDPVIVEYSVPGKPRNIVVEAPGVVWVTMPAENSIGRLTVTAPDNYTFDSFPVPTANSEPYDLDYRNGFIWFTEKAGNKIGRLKISDGSFTEFPIPTANSRPTGIDIAPNGQVWFLEQAGNKLTMFAPDRSTFTEHPVPAAIKDSGLEDVAVRSLNQIWFTAPDVNRAVAYIVDADQFDANATQTPTESYGQPVGIAMDPSSRPWVTSFESDAVGRYTPETLNFWKWFTTPTDNASVAMLAINDLGNLWQVFYTQNTTGQVGFFVVRESDTKLIDVVEVPLPTANSKPWGIAVDTDGHAWIAASNANIIAEWRPAYAHTVHLPFVTNR